MSVGKLRQRVQLEAPSGPADGAGGSNLSWALVASLWAQIHAVSGSEVLAFGRVNSSVTTRIRIRYRSDVHSDMRFRSGSRIFEIRHTSDPDGRRRWLDCACAVRPQ